MWGILGGMVWNSYIPFLNVYVKVLTFKKMAFGGDVFRRWCTQEDITFMTESHALKDLRELSDLFYYMRHSKSVHEL